MLCFALICFLSICPSDAMWYNSPERARKCSRRYPVPSAFNQYIHGPIPGRFHGRPAACIDCDGHLQRRRSILRAARFAATCLPGCCRETFSLGYCSAFLQRARSTAAFRCWKCVQITVFPPVDPIRGLSAVSTFSLLSARYRRRQVGVSPLPAWSMFRGHRGRSDQCFVDS